MTSLGDGTRGGGDIPGDGGGGDGDGGGYFRGAAAGDPTNPLCSADGGVLLAHRCCSDDRRGGGLNGTAADVGLCDVKPETRGRLGLMFGQ